MIDPTETAVLLISCPDRRGIVAAIAGRLSALEANILDADQHTDSTPEKPVFFQRIRVDLDEVRADRATFEREIAEEIGKLAAPSEGRLRIPLPSRLRDEELLAGVLYGVNFHNSRPLLPSSAAK